jgi:RND family efflux transporter MFP subunit
MSLWKRWTVIRMVLSLSGLPGLAAGAVAPPAPAEPFIGVVVPHDSVELSSRFDTRLERLEVEVGDPVRRGQVLAHLDTHSLQQELAGAQASLQGSRAEEHASAAALSEARERKGRYFTPRSLELEVYSQEELATVRYQERTAASRLEAARAQTRERQARVAELKQSLTEATLVAPFDGIVASRPVSPGARVSAGQPLLRLLGTGGWRVRFAVPEGETAKLAVGQPLAISPKQGGATLAGRVESVAPEVDAAARMVFAIATFEGPEPTGLATGMVVDVRAR